MRCQLQQSASEMSAKSDNLWARTPAQQVEDLWHLPSFATSCYAFPHTTPYGSNVEPTFHAVETGQATWWTF